MNIVDLFISRIRKIDKYKNFKISDKLQRYKWKEYVLRVVDKGELVIILDTNSFYRDEINDMNGLYAEIQKVGVGLISIDYPNKVNDEDVNMEDFKVIGIGFKNDFAKNNIRKQAMALGLSLTDFLLQDSKTINKNKYILIHNEEILNHWGLKSDMRILEERNFKFVIVDS